MKRFYKIIAGLSAIGSLALAGTVHAHPGDMENGMMQGGMGHHGMMGGGMGHRMGAGMGPGSMGQGYSGQGMAQQLMTPEERTAMQEKMRNAKTPEERQQLAAANHAEMHKRAQEKGITLPERGGPGAGMGPGFGPHRHHRLD